MNKELAASQIRKMRQHCENIEKKLQQFRYDLETKSFERISQMNFDEAVKLEAELALYQRFLPHKNDPEDQHEEIFIENLWSCYKGLKVYPIQLNELLDKDFSYGKAGKIAVLNMLRRREYFQFEFLLKGQGYEIDMSDCIAI